ncbi:hypothetical protein Hamer_G002243 [Homarus americanus]|uniref:Uncharacterized protein n=1 Tax=Homarus americanus TaxID=6706 RepID=A0A8J5JS24_HOMAM|nr:hypothetical protein Hamer_G002243 [Homarus americanus]
MIKASYYIINYPKDQEIKASNHTGAENQGAALQRGNGVSSVGLQFGLSESSVRTIKLNEKKIRAAYASPDVAKDKFHLKSAISSTISQVAEHLKNFVSEYNPSMKRSINFSRGLTCLMAQDKNMFQQLEKQQTTASHHHKSSPTKICMQQLTEHSPVEDDDDEEEPQQTLTTQTENITQPPVSPHELLPPFSGPLLPPPLLLWPFSQLQ